MHFPIPKPVYGRIAQVYSQSDDPGAASLLGIPPEIRNEIYECLLVNRQPITLFGEYDDKGTFSRVNDFVGSSGIIRTCRQIYHEALGILYGQNVFCFQCGPRYRGSRDPTIVDPIKTCTYWVKDIGSCLSALRTVTIDMDISEIPHEHLDLHLCMFKSPSLGMSILPLLDIFWNDIVNNISIEFESAGEKRCHLTDSDLEESEETLINFERVTSALRELGKNDLLGLKATRRLLHHVLIGRSGMRGTISYQCTGSNLNVDREFRLLEETGTYEIVPLPSPLGLLHMPTEIISVIARLALSNHEVTYNFETGITHRDESGLLNVNRQLREMIQPYFLSETRFTLILGSGTSQPAKAPYEVLERRVGESFESFRLFNFNDSDMLYCNPLEAAQNYMNKPNIVLQFQTVNHIKINAWDLLQVTALFPPGTTIIVRVRDHSDNVHVTTLGEIHRYALVFMEDFKCKSTPQSRCDTVEVWLNEQCLPVRVTTQKSHQRSEYVSSDEAEVLNTMDVTALHDAVEARLWSPYERLLGFEGSMQPERWDDKTTSGVVNRLKFLCMEPHDYR